MDEDDQPAPAKTVPSRRVVAVVTSLIAMSASGFVTGVAARGGVPPLLGAVAVIIAMSLLIEAL